MIKFDFIPEDKQLNPHYQRLEKCINEMNKAGNVEAVNHLALEAHKAVCDIWEINRYVLDMMGGGLS